MTEEKNKKTPPNEDQLKEHINDLLKDSRFKLESHGKTLIFVGPYGFDDDGKPIEPRKLELSGNDQSNLDAVETICEALLTLDANADD